MICYGTPDHNSGCSSTVTFDNALRNAPFTGIEPDSNSAIMAPQIEAEFVRKRQPAVNQHASSYAHWPSVVAGGDDFAFVEWAQNEIAVVPDFHKRILFSDEAHFWLNGYVNKQNCRIWSEANPQVHVETPLHPEKLTVWCALWAGGIIGSYFFKNDEGHNVTVNGDRYRAMITNFFIPELNSHDVQELWFQQDGATCHAARATIDLLKDTFGDRLISRFGPVNWPPRSCDLTPLDYFLWGYVKSLVYADKPQTLDHLEDNIRRVIADIRPQMMEKVIENWTSRLDIRANRGSPTPEIIFKM
ncbi:histone-lysine N-methyltransferase SETMAR [Trichonephila clavipes]|nr:histone-lysine N-methyltransferase SETMAR [Trichonephila clavipes]